MSISIVQLGKGYYLLQHMLTLLEDSDDTVLNLQLLGFCSSSCQISIVQCRCLPHFFYRFYNEMDPVSEMCSVQNISQCPETQ